MPLPVFRNLKKSWLDVFCSFYPVSMIDWDFGTYIYTIGNNSTLAGILLLPIIRTLDQDFFWQLTWVIVLLTWVNYSSLISRSWEIDSSLIIYHPQLHSQIYFKVCLGIREHQRLTYQGLLELTGSSGFVWFAILTVVCLARYPSIRDMVNRGWSRHVVPRHPPRQVSKQGLLGEFKYILFSAWGWRCWNFYFGYSVEPACTK